MDRPRPSRAFVQPLRQKSTHRRRALAWRWIALSSSIARIGFAQDPRPVTAAPPPEAQALAPSAPAAPLQAPKIETPQESTNFVLSAGGMLTTGNSRTVALTGSGAFDTRFEGNSLAASLLGNYGRSAPPGQGLATTAENVQGRLRYDRFIANEASFFLIVTGRRDRFQGLDFRLNLDPGFKYLFITNDTDALWIEGGYDFQYDVRRDDARPVLDANKTPVLDANGVPVLLDKTSTDNSLRFFGGFRHAFSQEVTWSAGVEYLQSVVDSTRYRLNFDTLFAAKLTSAFALGFGFSARYDHAPLPGKEKLDTSANVNLIFAYHDAPPAPPAPPK